jgi:hypothetical protein
MGKGSAVALTHHNTQAFRNFCNIPRCLDAGTGGASIKYPLELRNYRQPWLAHISVQDECGHCRRDAYVRKQTRKRPFDFLVTRS